MSTLLYALGRWSYRHPWRVLVAWLLLLVIAGGSAAIFMKGTNNSFSIPGTEAQAGIENELFVPFMKMAALPPAMARSSSHATRTRHG